MRVLLASEARFLRAAGRIWTAGPEDYRFWSSYAGPFDEVGVLARIGDGDPPAAARPASGPGVVFQPLDDYRGPLQYLARLHRLRAQVARAIEAYPCYLLRAPGAVAYLAWDAVRRRGRRYGAEILGDPWESLGPASGLTHPLQPAARIWSRRRLRALCRGAAAACYVSSELRRRYPGGPGPVLVCSDVVLCATASESALEARRVRAWAAASRRRCWRLGLAGSLERLYKAPEVLLDAVARCRRAGLDIELWVAGDGRFRPWLEQRAARLGLNGAARFLGALPAGESMERFLDEVDLFVLPSRTEGLPRVLVEAMARGCPAIGSTAGGIPELLEPEVLVEPGAAAPLALKIQECLGDPERLRSLARRNLSVARQYLWERLAPRRREFLWKLRSCYT